MTMSDHVVSYHEHVSAKPYEELVTAFEAAVADRQHGEFQEAFARAEQSAGSRESWEEALGSLFGPSGFMYVFAIDFGTLLGWYGNPRKAKMYVYGNPIVAQTMLRHDIRVADRVPLQIVIYEADNGEARIGYDLPSSIMSRYGNPELDVAARELDKKVADFVAGLTGSSA
jgi:uncharacterized protein (DUF302 family)